MGAHSGYFITLEGPEGSGKSLQAHQLAERLHEEGYRVTLTREPGGTPLGEAVRELILARRPPGEISPRAEALLFSASRAQLVAQVLRPRLAAGDIVICDRWADSTLAYQGYGRGISLEELQNLLGFATEGLVPDLTLYLDLSIEVGLARRGQAAGELNRLDREERQFHQRVRQGFLELAQAGGRWVLIDAEAPPERVREAIWEKVGARLSLKPQGGKEP